MSSAHRTGKDPFYQRLWKPWFVFRPTTLLRRVAMELQPPRPGYMPIRTSWGASIIADPSRCIGRSMLMTGVYELGVSETLARLISPGDTVVDVGANVGYMTVLAALLAGERGVVHSFEPHPELAEIAQRNVDALGKSTGVATVRLQQVALGAEQGEAMLSVPGNYSLNDGLASMVPWSDGVPIPVRVETIDSVLGSTTAQVLKLDVEGFELQVLHGAQRSLAAHQVRHLIFEDHNVRESAVVDLLRGHGYQIFGLGWTMRGPQVWDMNGKQPEGIDEAANFIATCAPEELFNKFQHRGWTVLRNLRQH